MKVRQHIHNNQKTAGLLQEIVCICQQLHTTISSLQSANAQNTKCIVDLEHSAMECSLSVMALETTVKRLQSEVCSLKEKCLDWESWCHCHKICLVGIEEGKEGSRPAQICAAVLKEILDLGYIPRLDCKNRKWHQNPKKERIQVQHGDVKDHILHLSNQKKQLFYRVNTYTLSFPISLLRLPRSEQM